MQQVFKFITCGFLFQAYFAFSAQGAYLVHNVPFISQSPFGDWREPYQNFCEEASVVMAAHFLWGAPLSLSIADLEMKIIKQYEELMFGDYRDTSAQQTAEILRVLYGFTGISVREVLTPDAIKKELNAGNIVLAPVAGRMLQNSYFVPPGPRYHMAVVIGFDDAKNMFITHDPGTRHGKNFQYAQSLFFSAIHDWNHGEVARGKKIVVVVSRK